ncbi:MAG TPA: septum formation initiator family protein [Gaiellaceae bacterium]|nr:septum formation initiator family protein [Gaiellaceae bacterium]
MAKGSRKPPRSRYVMRWVGVAAIVLVGLLYARPLRSYVQTKHDLARRAAEVQALKADRRALQHRLAESTTGEALTRQARRLGLVRPGERLFIVKGISAWVHGKATIDRGGR